MKRPEGHLEDVDIHLFDIVVAAAVDTELVAAAAVDIVLVLVDAVAFGQLVQVHYYEACHYIGASVTWHCYLAASVALMA